MHGISKIFLIVAVLILIVGTVAIACTKQEPSPSPTQSPKPSPSPSPEPKEEVFDITLQSMTEPGTWDFETNINQLLLEPIIKASNGRLNIQHVGSGAIVPNFEMHTAVSSGIIDMAVTTSLYYSGTFPATKFLYGYPGQFVDMREVLLARELGFIDVVRDIYKDLNNYLIDISIDHDLSMLTTENLQRLSDIQGVKIRAGGSIGEVFDRLGASVVMMPGSEIYTAMSTGVIEGVVYGTITSALDLGLGEITDYCVRGVHGPHFLGDYFINLDLWNSLPEDLQEIMRLGFYKGGIQNQIAIYNNNLQDYEEFTKTGGTLIVWPKEDMDQLTETSLGLMQELGATDPNAQKLYEIIQYIASKR